MKKVYEYDGKKYIFNHKKFIELTDSLRKRKNASKLSVFFDYAVGLKISEKTAENWYKEKNSPDNIEKIKDVAKYLQLTSFEDLLIEIEDVYCEEMYELLLKIGNLNTLNTTNKNNFISIINGKISRRRIKITVRVLELIYKTFSK